MVFLLVLLIFTISWNLYKYFSPKASTITKATNMKNLKTALYSWILSSTVFIIWGMASTQENEKDLVLFFGIIFISFFSFIAYLGLQLLAFVSEKLNLSEETEYILKITYTIVFYIPALLMIFGDYQLGLFAISSFICTLSVISYQYKPVFSKIILINKKSSIMETESFNIQHPEEPQQDKSSQYLTKGVILLVMGLVLWLATLFVENLANTREEVKDKSMEYFKENWGEQQMLAGPFLSVPYESKGIKGFVYLMPKKLDIISNVESAQKGRGIYENVTFRNQIQSKGHFDINELYEYMDRSLLQLDRATLCYGINDISSVIAINKFQFNGKSISTKNGWPTKDVSSNGLYANVDISNSSNYVFDIGISIKGTQSIELVPLGENTQIQLLTNWKNASFNGKYIPNEKPEKTENGIVANWNIQHFNRSFPQVWKDNNYDIWKENIQVNLSIPVNNYKKTTRAINYAILVIGLVFITFYIIEINNKKSIHPVQYLLVGLALCLFYGLLLSLSELISFDLSYLISAAMTILLISAYVRSVLNQNKLGVLTAISLSTIYGFLYILMIQENYSLLLGNLGLFIILAVIMYFTRKMNINTPSISN